MITFTGPRNQTITNFIYILLITFPIQVKAKVRIVYHFFHIISRERAHYSPSFQTAPSPGNISIQHQHQQLLLGLNSELVAVSSMNP